jgi:Flp pilus assembly protein TadD
MLKLFPRAAIGTAVLLSGCQTGTWMSSWKKPTGTEAVAGSEAKKPSLLSAIQDKDKDKKGPSEASMATVVENNRKGTELLQTTSADQSNVREAEKYFSRSLLVDPRNADAHHGMGICMDLQKRYGPAEEHYRAAIEADPKNDRYLADLGYSYYLQQRYAEAERYLKQSLDSNPGNTRATRNLALAYAKQGRRDLAESTFRRVMNDAEVEQAMARLDQDKSNVRLASAEKPAAAPLGKDANWDDVQARMDQARADGIRQREQSKQGREQQSAAEIAAYVGRDPYGQTKRSIEALESSSQTQVPNGPIYLDAGGFQADNRGRATFPEAQQSFEQSGQVQQLAGQVPPSANSWGSPPAVAPNNTQSNGAATAPSAAPLNPAPWPSAPPANSGNAPFSGQSPFGAAPAPSPNGTANYGYGDQPTTSNAPNSAPGPARPVQNGFQPQGWNGQPQPAVANSPQSQPNQGISPALGENVRRNAQPTGYDQLQAPAGAPLLTPPSSIGGAPNMMPPSSGTGFGSAPNAFNPAGNAAAPTAPAQANYGQPPAPPVAQTFGAAANYGATANYGGGQTASAPVPSQGLGPSSGPGDLEQAKQQAAMMGMGAGPGSLFPTRQSGAPASNPPVQDGVQQPGTMWNGSQFTPPQRHLPTNLQPPNLQDAAHPNLESTWDMYRQQTNSLGQHAPAPSSTYTTQNQFSPGSQFNANPNAPLTPTSLPASGQLNHSSQNAVYATNMQAQGFVGQSPANAIVSPANQQRNLEPVLPAPSSLMTPTWGNQSIAPPAWPSRTADDPNYRPKGFDMPAAPGTNANSSDSNVVVPDRYPAAPTGQQPPQNPGNYPAYNGASSAGLPSIVPGARAVYP